MAKKDEAGPRERMIAGAVKLLAMNGLQRTSFTEVLELTDAPRGSLAHHFPGGKDELVEEALALANAQMMAILEPRAGASAEEVTATFLGIWRTILTRGQLRAGCAVVAVTVASDSRDLLGRVAEIFRGWRKLVAELLARGGLAPADAPRFAATLLAASEGAVILCRGEQSLEPFELVSAQLLGDVRRLSPSRRGPA